MSSLVLALLVGLQRTRTVELTYDGQKLELAADPDPDVVLGATGATR